MEQPTAKKPSHRKRNLLCVAFAAVAAIGGNTTLHFASDDAPSRGSKNQVCASNSDPVTLSQKLPKISENFQLMAQLPITGKPVHDVISNTDNDIWSCSAPTDTLGEKVRGEYVIGTNTLKITGNDRITTDHESFHAVQDANGGLKAINRPVLTINDTMVSSLLMEATAAAYSYLAFEEAKKSGIPTSEVFPENKGGVYMKKVFDEVYNKTWKELEGTDAKTRQEKSMEAAGKAIVLGLLDGNVNWWMRGYILNAHKNAHRFSDKADNAAAGYKQLRHEIYFQAGLVSSQMNLTPDVLLGDGAGAKIDKILKKGYGMLSPGSDPRLKAPAVS